MFPVPSTYHPVPVFWKDAENSANGGTISAFPFQTGGVNVPIHTLGVIHASPPQPGYALGPRQSETIVSIDDRD